MTDGWRRRDTVIYAGAVALFCAFLVSLAFWPDRSPTTPARTDGAILRGRFPEEPPLDDLPDGGIIIEEYQEPLVSDAGAGAGG